MDDQLGFATTNKHESMLFEVFWGKVLKKRFWRNNHGPQGSHCYGLEMQMETRKDIIHGRTEINDKITAKGAYILMTPIQNKERNDFSDGKPMEAV